MNNIRIHYTVVFSVINIVALAFAAYTDHRWEDWYITYKSARNLAMGNGLVYHVGERLHTFTSPIGTLIPALLNFISGNASDNFVIWGFRVISSSALSLAGVTLFRLAINLNFGLLLSYFLIITLATHILIVDFSINGMETGFMILFMSMFISLMLHPERNLTLKLAIVMAALMLTRPDSFVYFGAIIIGFFLFHYKISNEVNSRRDFIMLFLKSGLLAIIIYSPWLITAAVYYGTPIPHTAVAKGLNKGYSLSRLGLHLVLFPYYALTQSTLVDSIFMPPYHWFGGWQKTHLFSKCFTLIAMFYFIYIKGDKQIRALSIGVFVMLFYLFRISGQGGMPWYLPNVALPVIVILVLIIHVHLKNAVLKYIAVFTIFFFNLFILIAGGHSLKLQQQIIENGNRKMIGLWLKENSVPGNTVFMECLGYIGFYSELKTFDFPGMSSTEVVESRNRLKSDNYALIINDIEPDWLVLRPWEVESIQRNLPLLLTEKYKRERIFDVSEKIPVEMYGKGYLLCDAIFTVYRKQPSPI